MQQVRSRLNIIFTAFLFSSLVYLIVGFALTKSGWKPIVDSGNIGLILFAVFLVLSIVLMGIALQIKNRLTTETDDALLPRAMFLFALSEVPAIFGLVLFLLTGKFLYLVVLCGVSIVSFVLVKPR